MTPRLPALSASFVFAAALVALVACGTSDAPASSVDAGTDASPAAALAPARRAVAGDSPYEKFGPHPVGHATFVVTDVARARALRLEVWYPAEASASAGAAAGTPLAELEPPGEARVALAALTAKAPPCTRTRVGSASDASPLAGAAWPVVAFSHCHGCMRTSAAQSMERLASHGIAVVAPDHAGDTLFDALKGVRANIDAATLAVRVGDVRFALDAVLDASNAAVPEALRGRFDPAKVGVMGHSFGAVTAGAVLAQDARARAALAIAAPIDALGGLKVAELKKPVFYLLAREDNSITEIGNTLIRGDFNAMTTRSWLAEVADAGHWSFSDVCGLHSSFNAGCGQGRRQTDPDLELNYLENEGARALAASYVVAFFRAQLAGDGAAPLFLDGAHPADLVTVRTR